MPQSSYSPKPAPPLELSIHQAAGCSQVRVKSLKYCLRLLLGILFLSLFCIIPSKAQGEPQVQIETGIIDPGGQAIYQLSGLKRGQRLYVYMDTASGNLDPIAMLLNSNVNLLELQSKYQAELQGAVSQSLDTFAAINALRDQYTLIWDDDSGAGYAAAFEYPITQDGDYRLLVGAALSSLGRETFGSFRLLVGIDAPQVLTGEAEPEGDPFVKMDKSVEKPVVRVQEVTGTINADLPVQSYALEDFNPGDVLYVYIEAISGDLKPILLLRDFGNKPLTAGNLSGGDSKSAMQYTFMERTENSVLQIYGGSPGEANTQGEYRILVGVNDPDVLTGEAAVTELPVLSTPIEVKIGVKLQQIIDVNQQDEWFGVVASMRMDWIDPLLAFSPDTCQCKVKIYTEKEFDRFLSDVNGRWPDFTLYNQQGNRWVQNRVAVLEPNGHATYFERFSTNLQVDFDFRQFPFDTQQFPIRIDMLYPQDRYYFKDLEDYSEISPEHGEDEFIITGFDTSIETIQGSTNSPISRFTFSYQAPRHLSYYILQVFVPILLIIAISWWTFFLKDYNKRIEVAAGNVLLFIAFSFSLTENYPRLGYLTVLDAVMAMIFIVNALVLIYNVYMRRLEMAGRESEAERIDNVMDWLYPVLYIIVIGIVYIQFFVRIPPP